MKPVRRRIRRHFGLTAKKVAIKSKRPWYFQLSATLVFIAVGYGVAYWQFATGNENLQQTMTDNQALNTKVIQLERQLQIEQAAQQVLTKELREVQDENIHIKEDLTFYKNMTNGRK